MKQCNSWKPLQSMARTHGRAGSSWLALGWIAAAILLPAACASASILDSNPDLIAYWKFDETNGTVAADSVSNSNLNNATLVNAIGGKTNHWVTGISGNAFNFNGAAVPPTDVGNEYLEIASSGGGSGDFQFTNNFTIAGWINPRSYGDGGFGRILDSYTTSASPPRGFSFLVTSTGGLRFLYADATPTYSSTTNVLALNTWQHVAITVSPLGADVTNELTLNFYVGGTNMGTAYTSDGAIPQDALTAASRLGGAAANSIRNFDGSMDEMTVWNRALTPAEVQLVLNATIPEPSSAGLLLATGVSMSLARRRWGSR